MSPGTTAAQAELAAPPDGMARPLRLLRLVAAFNLHPEHGMHPSWLPPGWPVRHRPAGARGPGGNAVLADCLRAWDPQAAEPDYDFQAPLRRIALMDAAAVRLLAALTGFAVHRQLLHLRGVGGLLRRQMRRYGDDVPRFVQERVPPMPSLAMSTRSLEARPHAAGAIAVRRGALLMLACLREESTPALRAVQRKLPRRVGQLAPPVLSGVQKQQLTELMLSCIVPERLPDWDWLF